MKSLLKYIIRNYWYIIGLLSFLMYFQIRFDIFVLSDLSKIFKALLHQELELAGEFIPVTMGFVLLSVLASVFIMICCIYLMSRFTYNLRSKMFDIVSNSYVIEDYNNIKHTAVMSRIIGNVGTEQYFIMFLLKRMVFIIVLIIFLCYLIPFNLTLISILLIFLTTISLLLYIALKRVSKGYFKVRKSQVFLTSLLYEKIKKFNIVRHFSKEEYENNYFDQKVKESQDLNIQFNNKLTFSLVASILVDILFCIWVYELVISFNKGLVDVFTVLLIIQVIIMLISYSDSIFKLSSDYSPVYVRSDEINKILDLERDDFTSNPDQLFEENIEKISFEDVSLNLSNKDILNNISFDMESNSTYLIMGSLASGKTSLAYLLIKFHEASSGNILINGKSIDNIPANILREKIRYVPTESLLFNDTLFENIRLGAENITKKDVIFISKKTLLSEYEFDLDENLYENRLKLTGDFKQKLSLTRALIHDGDVYIFDNCFSQFSLKTKTAIIANIKELLSDKILIFIENSYDKSYEVDNIIILDNTRIINQENIGLIEKNDINNLSKDMEEVI